MRFFFWKKLKNKTEGVALVKKEKVYIAIAKFI